jgi:CBS domain-containing membrane protein
MGTAARPNGLLRRRVKELMRRRYIAVTPKETLYDADRLMRLARIRHLPVVHDGLLVGVLSHRDILEASIARLEDCLPEERAGHLQSIHVERMMRHSPETVAANCSLADAAVRIYQFKIGCLPVVENTPEGLRLLGLITETDLLRAAYDPDFGWEAGD